MKILNSLTNKVKLLLKKLMLIILSAWSYMPIIMGILIPMAVYLPLVYGSCSKHIFPCHPNILQVQFNIYLFIQ